MVISMKKLIIIFITIILLCGCEKQKENKVQVKENKKEETIVEEKETYKDLNNTPIALYKLSGNKLTKLTETFEKFIPMEDIGIFQIYPSNEDIIYLNSFGNDFYNEWIKYDTNNNLKIGFNIKYTLNNGETISYNILSPANNFDHYEYLMNYLYDDYANQNKSFYSHVEENDLNENTLYTSIKIQCNADVNSIKEKIELTVFTYDSEDDFLDNEYRGNSKYTYTIKKRD